MDKSTEDISKRIVKISDEIAQELKKDKEIVIRLTPKGQLKVHSLKYSLLNVE